MKVLIDSESLGILLVVNHVALRSENVGLLLDDLGNWRQEVGVVDVLLNLDAHGLGRLCLFLLVVLLTDALQLSHQHCVLLT